MGGGEAFCLYLCVEGGGGGKRVKYSWIPTVALGPWLASQFYLSKLLTNAKRINIVIKKKEIHPLYIRITHQSQYDPCQS